jgi:hypothetical protein
MDTEVPYETQWIRDSLRRDPYNWVGTAALYASWKAWMEARELTPGSMRRFSIRLQNMGFHRRRNSAKTNHGFVGWQIISRPDQPRPQQEEPTPPPTPAPLNPLQAAHQQIVSEAQAQSIPFYHTYEQFQAICERNIHYRSGTIPNYSVERVDARQSIMGVESGWEIGGVLFIPDAHP